MPSLSTERSYQCSVGLLRVLSAAPSLRELIIRPASAPALIADANRDWHVGRYCRPIAVTPIDNFHMLMPPETRLRNIVTMFVYGRSFPLRHEPDATAAC